MDTLQQLSAVAGVIGLLILAVAGLGRASKLPFHVWRRATAPGRRMEVVDRLHLGPHHCLHQIRIGERELLLATHTHGITVVEPAEAFPAHLSNALLEQGKNL